MNIDSLARKLLHLFGIHHWSENSFMPGNVAQMDKMFKIKYQRYTLRRCWICKKEMPHSRYYFNLGIIEKHARR